MMSLRSLYLSCLAGGLFCLIVCPVQAEDSSAGNEFFEKKIRPVLVESCYSCHSAGAEKLRGKLRLDTRAGLRQGGRNGPAVIPGNVKDSLLIQALRYQGLEMPPKGQLPPQVIADFEQWIKMGAPDPRSGTAEVSAGKTINFPAARKHWAFLPITAPALPPVKQTNWPISPIDHFVLAKLEEKGLTPASPAERRTLIRRAYYDLIGLPPTFEEVQAFLKDERPDAFAQVVDRLLASPHYGERWGRHWLDVARYADTKDLVLLFGNDRIRPYAYTYRDYVIRAFNEDVPYDRFIQQQLAADQIEPKVPSWQLAALGFLTLGRLFDNNLPDIYDDQIDTVTRGFLGLTVSCARCHDHKYDAIPTADYYALYGVFANCERPLELPLIAEPKATPEYEAFAKKMAAKRQELHAHIRSQYDHINELVRSQVTEYLQKMTEPPGPLETVVFFLSLSPRDLRPSLVARWRRYLNKQVGPEHPVFGPWHEWMQTAESDWTAKATDIQKRWIRVPAGIEPGRLNPLVQQALSRARIASRADVAALYGELLQRVYTDWKKDPGEFKKGEQAQARQQLLEVMVGSDSPFYFPHSNTYLYMSRVPRDRYHQLERAIDRLAVDSTQAPPRAMVLNDVQELLEPRVFIRGNPRRQGPTVQRHFLQVLCDGPPRPFPHGSGRLDLAKAITAADNPLTARVMVNRVWMHHFGEPLVATPSDFGTRSQPPRHPHLLDHLAWTFQKEGWSLKQLHRHIMLSKTYQQASADRPDCRKSDPENRLWWRYPRRHLDLEALRDSLLTVSGQLDRSIGGRPVDVAGDPSNRQRTIYGLVDRQDLPSLYRVFNFASPDQSADRRPQTMVPQQALFGLNSAFVQNQAKALAELVSREAEPQRRIAALYQRVLQREPTAAEAQLAQQFLQAAEAAQATPERSQLTPWQQYAQILLLTNEFTFVE